MTVRFITAKYGENEQMRTMDDLKQMQALPLSLKVSLTKSRIRQWINEYGEDGVYVSFSGGKDSTVLLHLVRQDYPNVEAVFVDTGLEYPEIKEFVRTFDNVTWLRPKMSFRKVIETYGYPFISKEVSQNIKEARQNPNSRANSKFDDNSSYVKKYGQAYSLSRWTFLRDSEIPISQMCCNVMKKTPAHKYHKESGKNPITAQMASESRLRTNQWVQNGCNGFNLKIPTSNPMSFWTEQDVLQYIKMIRLPICSVYGDIVEDGEITGQMSWAEFDDKLQPPKLKTTGCSRTGCMFCGYGCHLEKEGEGKFEMMKVTHPKLYEYIMKPWEDGGLGYKDVIDWINENGNLNIRY